MVQAGIREKDNDVQTKRIIEVLKMDLNTAMLYMNKEHQDEFGKTLEQYVLDKSDDNKKKMEEFCMVLMSKYPPCVYEPFVNVYKVLRDEYEKRR